MKAKLSIITAVILFAASNLYAVPQDKIFTSSGHILPREEWANVSIYNDGTLVNMLGGSVHWMGTYDASMVNVTGGFVGTLDARQFSTANISAGYVYGLHAWDHAITNFFDGANLFAPRVRNFGTINMTGGVVDHLGAIDSATINLWGGVIADGLSASDSSIINIFGYDLVKTASGGRYGYGQVYGFWFDDNPFTIDLNLSETYSRINLIPEPSSLILLALGTLLIRRRQ